MHAACMATKTISIDLAAHRRLSKARRTPKESFSQVIKRAHWEAEEPITGEGLRSLGVELGPLSPEVIDALEAGQESDAPPEDRWAK